MNFIVYKTTNLLNGRFYVGVHGTESVEEFDGYYGSGFLLKPAIKKYGKENFIRETLVECFEDEEEAYSIEAMLVKIVKEDPRSYNIMPGGSGYSGIRTQRGSLTKEELKSNGRKGAYALISSGRNWFQVCSREDLLKYAQKSNETKRLRNSRCDFKSIKWQRENSKNNDHSGARGILTFNNGSKELKFKPSDRNNKNLIEKELKIFIENNPTFKRGGLNKIKGRPKRYVYNDGIRNYYFSASSLEVSIQDALKQFHKFLMKNTYFVAGKLKQQLSQGE
jgi:hypothetical protein